MNLSKGVSKLSLMVTIEELEMALKRQSGLIEAYIIRAEHAEAALAEYKVGIPWESMWLYFSHGDYGPDAWQEVDEWLRRNMPVEVTRSWLGQEVLP